MNKRRSNINRQLAYNNMDGVDAARKENKSTSEDAVSQPSVSENVSDKLVCSTTGIEKMQLAQDEGKQKSLEMNMSEATSVVNSERTEVSEVSLTSDPNESLGEICEDLSETGESVTMKTGKDALGEESRRFPGERDSCKQEMKSQGNHHSLSSDKEIEVERGESKIGFNLSEETVSPNLRVEKQGTEIEIMQSGESKSSNSKQEVVSMKAGKKDKNIKLQSEANNGSSSKEENVSVKTENQGKDIKLQNEKSKTSTSKEIVSLKTEKRGKEFKQQRSESKASTSEDETVSLKKEKQGKDTRLQRDESKASKAREKDVSSKVERQDRETKILSDQNTTLNSKEGITRSNKCKQDVKETLGKEVKKDHCCQANFSSDKMAKSDELKMLKEKLAISKKDTETMQKVLEDVRKDYEELQKNFETKEREIKSKAFVEQLMKENDELKKEKAELNRKTSKKEEKVSSTAAAEKVVQKLSEKLTTEPEKDAVSSREKIDSSDLSCPCFAQNIRKVISDVKDDFKEAILVIKQSSSEQRESIGKEFAQLKDEFKCALEKKDCEIHLFEETIKGLQARIREGEREDAEYRSVISSAFEEKQKLYDNVRVLKDELAKAQRENEASRADAERIKYGLKKYCTAEEYEELQRLNFKFIEGKEADGAPVRQSDSNDGVSELRSKAGKSYPVLKKAKKDIVKMKEEKEDIENRLQAKISQASEKEKYLNKKLNKALSDLKESDVKVAELTGHLEELIVEKTKLNVKVDEIEAQGEELRRKHWLELRTANDKLKISNDSLVLHQTKYNELQDDYQRLCHRYDDLKKVLEDLLAKEKKQSSDDSSRNEHSSEHPLKVSIA